MRGTADVDGAAEWDDRYASHDHGLWSGRPNSVLVGHVAGQEPGRALDVGCGEGADAIWLASQGWRVTAVDISQVAIDRAAAAALAAGVSLDWVRADIVAGPPTPGGYDLVSVQYPHLPRSADEAAIRVLVMSVAPNGTLLVVGHAPIDPAFARAHGFDPADHVDPADVAAALDDSWKIEIFESRPRTTPPPPGTPFTHDTVLLARRRS